MANIKEKKPTGRTPLGTFEIWCVCKEERGGTWKDRQIVFATIFKNRAAEQSAALEQEAKERNASKGFYSRERYIVSRKLVRDVGHGHLLVNANTLRVPIEGYAPPPLPNLASSDCWTRNLPNQCGAYWWHGDTADSEPALRSVHVDADTPPTAYQFGQQLGVLCCVLRGWWLPAIAPEKPPVKEQAALTTPRRG